MSKLPGQLVNSSPTKLRLLNKPEFYSGIIWKLFGICQTVLFYMMSLAGGLLIYSILTASENGSVLSYFFVALVAILVAILLIFFIIKLQNSARESYLKGKKILAAAWPSPLSRRPIVYLRSFQDDIRTAESNPPFVWVPTGPNGGSLRRSISFITEEEELAAVMNKIGPFCAIGLPGESLPELGAYRIYVKDKWEEEVITRISAAQLVIIRLGTTKGVLWELHTAIKLVEPNRLLLLVPWEKNQYEEFRRTYATSFPSGLPEYGVSEHIGSIHGIICFWPDWTPHFLQINSKMQDTTKLALQRVLSPVFKRLGLSQ